MPSFKEMVEKYKKRRHDTVVDAVTTGLSLADNVTVDLGLLEDTGVATEIAETVSNVLPFAVIAVTEQCKVLLGKKTGAAGAGDAAYRMVKTGAALGVGGAVASAAGFWAAIPVTMGVRALFDRYRSRALTGMRVQGRIARLKELNASLRQEARPVAAPAQAEDRLIAAQAVATVE